MPLGLLAIARPYRLVLSLNVGIAKQVLDAFAERIGIALDVKEQIAERRLW